MTKAPKENTGRKNKNKKRKKRGNEKKRKERGSVEKWTDQVLLWGMRNRPTPFIHIICIVFIHPSIHSWGGGIVNEWMLAHKSRGVKGMGRAKSRERKGVGMDGWMDRWMYWWMDEMSSFKEIPLFLNCPAAAVPPPFPFSLTLSLVLTQSACENFPLSLHYYFLLFTFITFLLLLLLLLLLFLCLLLMLLFLFHPVYNFIMISQSTV